jgi:hypothetical protein
VPPSSGVLMLSVDAHPCPYPHVFAVSVASYMDVVVFLVCEVSPSCSRFLGPCSKGVVSDSVAVSLSQCLKSCHLRVGHCFGVCVLRSSGVVLLSRFVQSESSHVQSESSLQSESSRVQSESSRVQSESCCVQSESSRAQSESCRAQSESCRVQSEYSPSHAVYKSCTVRVKSCTVRVKSCTVRVKSCTVRVQSESSFAVPSQSESLEMLSSSLVRAELLTCCVYWHVSSNML